MGQMSSSSKQFLHVSAMSEAIAAQAGHATQFPTSSRPLKGNLTLKNKSPKLPRKINIYTQTLVAESDKSP